MRVTRFEHEGTTHTGAVVGEEIADLGAADPVELLGLGPAAIGSRIATAPRVPLAAVRLRAPIPRPPKFLAIGLNYADHIAESGMATPEFPVFFNKQTTCVTGPGDPVHVPRVSPLVDYEGELGAS
jgi:2-keto-4-pentenoate hydratase/2-oxohepta-3-ene-1,7-dioic acid hydratase in catechol pathway